MTFWKTSGCTQAPAAVSADLEPPCFAVAAQGIVVIRWTISFRAIALTIFALVAGTADGAIDYSDQGSHEFSGQQTDVIVVSNSTQLTYRGFLPWPADPAAPYWGGAGVTVLEGSHLLVSSDTGIDCGWNEGGGNCAPVLVIDASTAELKSGELRGQNGSSVVNGSELQVTGGSISSYGNGEGVGVFVSASELEITGGAVRADNEGSTAVVLDQGSVLTMVGGTIFARGEGQSAGVDIRSGIFRMLGGEIHSFDEGRTHGVLVGEGEFHMEAGILEVQSDTSSSAITATSSTRVTIHGGTISQRTEFGANPSGAIVGTDDSHIDISGGAIVSTGGNKVSSILAMNRASITISGGQFSTVQENGPAYDVVAIDDSHVTIVGTSFNYPLHQPLDVLSGEIVGLTLDGKPLEISFNRAKSAVVVLVPEPSSWSLVLIGIVIFVSHVRRGNVICKMEVDEASQKATVLCNEYSLADID